MRLVASLNKIKPYKVAKQLQNSPFLGFFYGQNLTKVLIINAFANVAQFALYIRHLTT